MDQKKTGAFIAQIRKEKGFTQRQLAEALTISDKTVSKWECGNGLPEVSLMLPLCELLGITVNELLSGKRLRTSEYKQNAEKNLMDLMEERKDAKVKLWLEAIIVFITILAPVTLLLLASYGDWSTPIRVVIIIIALLVMLGGIIVAAILEMRAGAFECSKCGHRFIPTAKAYLMGAHTIMRRKLKCPKCGKRNWCVRTLTLETDKTLESKKTIEQEENEERE